MTIKRFSIDDLMIVDTECNPVHRMYIRELLDSASSEYQRSKLNRQQKVDIINELGIDTLTEVLAECFLRKGASYNAAQEARFTWAILTGKGLTDEAN
ncbi:MAG: hypothetical protein PXX73_05130 [Sideroxydans sp.]|nr:hypothetical protein [Sideroxydans sp.]